MSRTERIHITGPVGTTDWEWETALFCGRHFATEKPDGKPGVYGCSVYGYTDHTIVAWWTRTRAISVRIQRVEVPHAD